MKEPTTSPLQYVRRARAELRLLRARNQETWRTITAFRAAVEEASETIRAADALLATAARAASPPGPPVG